ncbi:hypothetical protein ACFLUU_06545 [Chloroflexota bacterium]
MTGIGGWYDYQQTLTVPYGPFGWSIWLWGIIIAGLGSLLLIGQMWYRIRRLENPRTNLDVYPCFLSKGKKLTLFVHNRSDIRALISATMTCKQYNNDKEEGAFAIEPELINASMCWEATGNYEQNLKADGRCNLNLCRFGERTKDGIRVKYITFFKVAGGVPKEVEFARHTEDNTPRVKVVIKVHFDAEPSISGKREWKFLVEPGNNDLTIRPETQLIGKSLIRKVLRPNKL